MSTAEEKMFQEAKTAIEDGNKARGKDLLTRLLKQDQENAEYWLWMSAVVDSAKERRYCLKQTLKLDPENKMARRGLILMGDLPLDESLIIPYEAQKRKWQLPQITPIEQITAKPPWLKIGLVIVGVSVAIALVIMAFRSDRLWNFRYRNLAAIGTAMATPTYPASATPTITITPRIIEPTPPWNILASTYTPTPIYVNTPHAIIEAYSIAMRNYQNDDWDDAIRYFLQAIQSKKDAPDLYFRLGEAYLQNGDISNATLAYGEAININVNFAPGYFGRAKTLMLRNETTLEAVNDLLTAIDLDPEYGEAYLLLVQAYIKEEEPEKAREYLSMVESLLPDSPLLDLAKGRIALSEQDFNQALSLVENAFEKDLTLLEAYRFLGEVYQASGNAKASLEPLLIYARYQSAMDLQADILLSRAYAANEQYDEAIQLMNTILTRDPAFYEGFIQRGMLYTELENFTKAFEDFSTAFKLAPKSFETCIILSEASFPLKKPGNAYQQASECQKLAGSDQELAHMYFVRALALEALKNNVAKRDWERMLELDPEAISPAWKATAEFYLNQYYTATPTPSETPKPTSSTKILSTTTVTPTITSPVD